MARGSISQKYANLVIRRGAEEQITRRKGVMPHRIPGIFMIDGWRWERWSAFSRFKSMVVELTREPWMPIGDSWSMPDRWRLAERLGIERIQLTA